MQLKKPHYLWEPNILVITFSLVQFSSSSSSPSSAVYLSLLDVDFLHVVLFCAAWTQLILTRLVKLFFHLNCGLSALLVIALGLHVSSFLVHFSSELLATCPARHLRVAALWMMSMIPVRRRITLFLIQSLKLVSGIAFSINLCVTRSFSAFSCVSIMISTPYIATTHDSTHAS